MKNFILFMGCILLTLAVGGVSGFATVKEINGWYGTLIKPSFNPPNYLFGPVWTCLYLLMGVSLYIIIKAPKTPARSKAITIFAAQLVLNFCWSIIFFSYHTVGWALAEIILMWIMILWMIIAFYRISKTAAFIQLPYIAWVSFATVLNTALFYLNM